MPYMFEDPDWRSFFWSSLPSGQPQEEDDETMPLAKALVTALCVRRSVKFFNVSVK